MTTLNDIVVAVVVEVMTGLSSRWRTQKTMTINIHAVVQRFKISVSGLVQDMKLSMNVYKYITTSVKEPTSYLRLPYPDCHLWPQDRSNRTYSHSGVIDEWSGVRTPYRANAQCRELTDSNLSTWNDKNPSSCFKPEPIRFRF